MYIYHVSAMPHATVLDEDDFNETDKKLIRLLEVGRITPQFAADELDVSREWVSDRLRRLHEHDIVEKRATGLYELNPENVPDGVSADTAGASDDDQGGDQEDSSDDDDGS